MSGWLLLFGVGVTFICVLPFIFFLLIQRYAWMIAYLSLFMTVFTGSWVWLAILIVSWTIAFRRVKHEAWLLTLSPEQYYHQLMKELRS